MPGCGYCGNSPAKRDVPPADQTWTSSADSTRQTDRQTGRQTDRHKPPTRNNNNRQQKKRREQQRIPQRLVRMDRGTTAPDPQGHLDPSPLGPVASPSRVLSSGAPGHLFQYPPPYLPTYLPTYLILHHGLPLHNGLWNRGSSKFTLSVSSHQTAGDTFLLLCLGPAAIPLLLAFAFPRSQPHHTCLPCKSLKLMSSFCPFHHALPPIDCCIPETRQPTLETASTVNFILSALPNPPHVIGSRLC
ncbi:hypothetical protein IWX50DRAFT_417268 [Phyllosticta citricarpa]|uniref:Uncharacterized protein n=1 Tax=Phyllosticta citricarpa TaxID=55181 RepID=A0ABR1L6Y8_9PEZI